MSFGNHSETTFIKLLKTNIYTIEKNSIGYAVIILKDFIPCEIHVNHKNLFLEHIVNTVKKSLEISKKYNKLNGVVDLYVNDCGPRNFSLPFFKKINKILSETFVDSLGEFNIYSNSPIFNNVWKIIRVLIDRDTREKINIISV